MCSRQHTTRAALTSEEIADKILVNIMEAVAEFPMCGLSSMRVMATNERFILIKCPHHLPHPVRINELIAVQVHDESKNKLYFPSRKGG